MHVYTCSTPYEGQPYISIGHCQKSVTPHSVLNSYVAVVIGGIGGKCISSRIQSHVHSGWNNGKDLHSVKCQVKMCSIVWVINVDRQTEPIIVLSQEIK